MKTTFKMCTALLWLLTLLCACGSSDNSHTAHPDDTGSPTAQHSPAPLSRPYILGEYETPILNIESDRLNNLSLACKKINGSVVDVGDEFSFNGTVGQRTKERGFTEGVVFEGKKKTEGVGGGVCQVSTTLFGASKNAALEITERHEHKLDVDYVAPGDDAAVAYGELDFKFKNTQSQPIKIEAFLTKSTVCVRIWAI